MGSLLHKTSSGGESGYELHEGNALWLQKEFAFREEYLIFAHDNYAAALEHADFKGAPEQARTAINDKVSQQTNGRIKDLLPAYSVSEDTRLVVSSATYFRAGWSSPFTSPFKKVEAFHVSRERSVDVPLMHTTASFDYFEAPSFQIVALPYRGDNLSMIVFLPKQNVELARFEELLAQANLTEWLANLRPDPRMIDLTIPRFKVTLQVDLEDALRRMGVNAAFSNKADFPGITASGFINISAIRHKAYISVDEEGTEAAAVTAVGMTYNSQISPQPVPIVFRADHPFAFLIQDRRSGVILFLGRLSNPQE